MENTVYVFAPREVSPLVFDAETFCMFQETKPWGLKTSSSGKKYLSATKQSETRLFHRVAMKATKAFSVDHVNGNTLDNRFINLRLCTHQENCRNIPKRRGATSSQYKGVYWRKERNAWQAQIRNSSGIRKYLGLFSSELDAAESYNRAALLEHSAFASVNVVK